MKYRDQYRERTTRRWSLRRAGVALIAAYALALQALFASFGVGAALVRHQANTIAGVICSGGGASSPAPLAPLDHDRADCCILCGAPAPALPDHVSALKVATKGLSSRVLAPLGLHRRGTMAWLPGGARAPPPA